MGNVTTLRPVEPDRQPDRCPSLIADPELAQVLAEISRIMAADGAVLSLHGDHDAAPELLGACVAPELGDDLPSLLSHAGLAAFAHDGAGIPHWTNCRIGQQSFDVLMLPVSPIKGHNRLVLSVLFDRPSRDVRDFAEQLFQSRQPIAMGYFRLWQLERVRSRRVAALEAACDITDMGILLFTHAGDLDFVNAAANDLLAIGDGLRRHRGSVQASDISDSVKFQVAFNHAMAANDSVDGTKAARRHAPLVRLHRATGEPLIAVIVAAEQPAVEPSDVAVMVYLFDPAFEMDRALKPVCSAFRLSPVEANLACQLAAGRSIADAADALRIKVQTARGYLKHIFIKTDTRRQPELVHLMLSNIFRVGRTISPEVL